VLGAVGVEHPHSASAMTDRVAKAGILITSYSDGRDETGQEVGVGWVVAPDDGFLRPLLRVLA